MKQKIRHLIESRLCEDSLAETGIEGVRMFRATAPIPCMPAVYEPTIVAIVNGTKEAVVDGKRYVYDSSRYLCCPITMPVEAGTPEAGPDNPLLGVVISLDTGLMRELAVEIESAGGPRIPLRTGLQAAGLTLARWDDAFTDALFRLMCLVGNPADIAVLGKARLRELYYAVLKGDAGGAALKAFGVGNEIARAIAHVSTHLAEPITIGEMAARAGMSRAAFHRKFKQATTMSPIQFVKSMRLNSAATRIAEGTPVSKAAWDVGYMSSSQFSREFRRAFGRSPKQWSRTPRVPAALA